jgi:hypothetical protein
MMLSYRENTMKNGTIQHATFRNFMIEASAVKMGTQWRPQCRISRGNRKTAWSTPRADAFADSALAVDAAIRYAKQEIQRGWGSCFA